MMTMCCTVSRRGVAAAAVAALALCGSPASETTAIRLMNPGSNVMRVMKRAAALRNFGGRFRGYRFDGSEHKDYDPNDPLSPKRENDVKSAKGDVKCLSGGSAWKTWVTINSSDGFSLSFPAGTTVREAISSGGKKNTYLHTQYPDSIFPASTYWEGNTVCLFQARSGSYKDKALKDGNDELKAGKEYYFVVQKKTDHDVHDEGGNAANLPSSSLSSKL